MKNPDKMSERELRAEVKSHRWISVETKLPDQFQAVLVQHIHDRYPDIAYWSAFADRQDDMTMVWVYECGGLEGEESYHPNHRHLTLRQPPTHWMNLPDAPF
jgi:hypothetical protein